MTYWIKQKIDNKDIVDIFIGPFSAKVFAINWIKDENLSNVKIIEIDEE